MGWEKISSNHISDKGLISKICKQSLLLNIKRTKTQSKNGQNRHFLNKIYRWLLLLLLLLSHFSRVRLCVTLDSSPPGSPVPGILQARTLEWAAISFSSAWKWKVKVKSLSRVQLLATPWTAAYQAPPPMGFSRQEYWNGLPLPSPTDGYRPMKRCSALLIVEKSKSKQQDSTSHLWEWLLSKRQEITSDGEDLEKRELVGIVGGIISWCSHCGEQYEGSSKH